MNQVVTGYTWDTESNSLIPVWGPPALAPGKPLPAKQRPEYPLKGTTTKPRADKVITSWSMPGKIFRISAHLHHPDSRHVVVYGNSFNHCMHLLEEESKAGLPYSIEVNYDGKTVKVWNRKEHASDQWGTDCCRDVVDEMIRRSKAGDQDAAATRVRELEACP